MATELFSANLATTTVSSGGTDAPSSGTTETWTVASSVMFGAASTGVSQFHVADAASGKGTEIIAVTNVSGTTWTVTRGAESTTPVAHVAGFAVYQVTTAGFLGSVLQAANNLSVLSAAENYAAGTVINLNVAYGVSPAQDITTALQEAINTLATAGGGTVEISELGTYYINGATQTGVVASTTVTTTATGTQALPESVVTVGSTAGFFPAGYLSTPAGLVKYTGLTSVTFTGCTGGSGTLTGGAAVAQAYQYAGQVLFPATNFNTGTCAIRIRGANPPTTGIASTGLASGVVLLSNATSGYVFDTVPLAAGSEWNWIWTGVQPMFENLVVRLPENPQCGGINMLCALRSKVDRLQVDSAGDDIDPSTLTGSLEALVLPQVNNNGDVTCRDLSIRGVPYGVRLSEHNVFNGNTEIVGCLSGFVASYGGHLNDLGYFDVEACYTIFTVDVPSSDWLISVTGHLDTQDYGSIPTVLLNDPQGQIIGSITQSPVTAGGMGMLIPLGTSLDAGNAAIGNSGGWSLKYPDDNFTRVAASMTSVKGAPGQSWPSLHPWRVPSSSSGWAVSSNGLTATGTGQALVPVYRGFSNGEARSVTTSVTLASSGWNIGQILSRQFNLGSHLLAVRIVSSTLYLDVGPVGADTASVSVTLTGGATCTLVTELYYSQGNPWLVRVLINGVPQLTYVLSSAQQATIAASPNLPYSEDGVYSGGDTTSVFNSFVERPMPGLVPSLYLFAASATRQALHFESTLCTSGTFTVTLPAPGAEVPNVVTNTGSGTITVTPPSGTLTNLAGATGNITLAQGTQAFIMSDGTNYFQVAGSPTAASPLPLAQGGTGVSESSDAALLAALGAAPLASPALTGSPTAPTASALTDNTQIASTAYADSAVAVEKSRAQTAEALALPKSGGTMSGGIAMGGNAVTGTSDVAVSGLTGATAASRYAGATTGGPPVTGTFSTLDWVMDENGFVWICTSGGSPGTWVMAAGNVPWLPADDGFLAGSYDPAGLTANGSNAGVIYAARIAIRYPMTVSQLIVEAASAASGTSTGTFVGLYTASGTTLTRVAVSADVASNFTAAGMVANSFTAPVALTPGFVWGTILLNLSVTQPALFHVSNLGYTGVAGAVGRGFSSGSGQTALPTSFTGPTNGASTSYFPGMWLK